MRWLGSSPRQHPLARRPAFTLIELLVVIGIIGVLMALAAGATVQFIVQQRQSNTEATLRKLNHTLQQAMKAVVDQADKEDYKIPASVVSMAGGDRKRALVIWKKLRLKQEFPQTFAEAREPHKDSAGQAVLSPADLPPKQAYVRALQGKTPTAAQSSELLLLALLQNRGGIILDVDSLAGAVTDTNGNGLREIVDGWGVPIQFTRWPINAELDQSNPALANPSSRAARFCDPFDPAGQLLTPAWFTGGNRPVFERLCHTISPNPTAANTARRAYYIQPMMVSAGRNEAFGDGDDIYSFRLRFGARGD